MSLSPLQATYWHSPVGACPDPWGRRGAAPGCGVHSPRDWSTGGTPATQEGPSAEAGGPAGSGLTAALPLGGRPGSSEDAAGVFTRDSRHKEKGLGGVGARWEGAGRRDWSEVESSHNLEGEALLLLLQGSLPLAGPASLSPFRPGRCGKERGAGAFSPAAESLFGFIRLPFCAGWVMGTGLHGRL